MGFIFDVFIVSAVGALIVNVSSIIGGMVAITLISTVIFLLGCAVVILCEDMSKK